MGATIKDVAKLAGTSTATVSKVMNGSYSISQETADKVRKAMEELDYHPNLRAKNFARQSARTIIFVAELGKGTGFANPQMFEILCGLEEVLAQKDYTLVVRNIAAGDCAEFIRNAADTKQADGFVIHASVISQALDELLFTHEIPHIVIGNPNFNSHFCWLDIDNRLAGELAAKHLLERGCQSVAFIGGKPEDQISARRLDGVLTVLKEHDVLLPREYVKKGESVCDSGYRMTMQILENRRRPDALVCADNYIAYGCVNALHDRGILIPEEMKVITFDDFPFSQILKPMLSVVNIDVYDMGVQAGKYILQKINSYVFHNASGLMDNIIAVTDALRRQDPDPRHVLTLVPTLDGKVDYEIPEGTQTGREFILREKGIPEVGNTRRRGNERFTVVVETPTRLTKEQKDLLRQLDGSVDQSPKRKKFLNNLKDFFG